MPSFEEFYLQRELYYNTKLVALTKHIKEQIPNFSVRKKKDSLLMRILGTVLFFNKRFMDTLVTTVYPCVYLPVEWDEWSNSTKCAVLAHEYVHLKDAKRFWILFEFMYLMPQILSLFAIGAIWNPYFIWFLLFLLPISSATRTWLEYRGYRMEISVNYWLTGGMYDIEFLAEQFTGPAYYFMFPFKNTIRKKLRLDLNKVMDRSKLTEEVEEIKKVLKC